MDEYGIYAQVLYPNLIGFEAPLFMDLGSELSLDRAPRRHLDDQGRLLGHPTRLPSTP